uniref:Phospholipase A2 n=1 Tax=Toxopneustes pileolus TaxID=39971 RepID=A0A0D6AA52_TOXPI|nr:contractin A [Toxopneustes pileolus]
MLFIFYLLVAIFLSFASGNAGDPGSERLDEESVINFGWMSSCVTNSTSTRYNGYGCYCGFGGSGTPVDDLDKCCQVHDKCYGDIMAAEGGPCPDDTNIYRLSYYYECKAPWSWIYRASELTVSCNKNANSNCQQALCDCDLVASRCFASNKYNPEYASYNKENCVD